MFLIAKRFLSRLEVWFSDIEQHTYTIVAVFNKTSRVDEGDIRMVEELQSELAKTCPASFNQYMIYKVIQEMACDIENEAQNLFHIEYAAESLRLFGYSQRVQQCLNGYYGELVDKLLVDYRQRLLEQMN